MLKIYRQFNKKLQINNQLLKKTFTIAANLTLSLILNINLNAQTFDIRPKSNTG